MKALILVKRLRLRHVLVEMVAAFPLTRGRSVFIRSPRGSGAAAAATLGSVVMRLGRRRRGEDEVWMVVVVVVVTAETTGAPEACRTLPRPSRCLLLLEDVDAVGVAQPRQGETDTTRPF